MRNPLHEAFYSEVGFGSRSNQTDIPSWNVPLYRGKISISNVYVPPIGTTESIGAVKFNLSSRGQSMSVLGDMKHLI